MSATSFRLDSACLPLHRLEAFEQSILDGIQDLLLVLAPDGRVLHASQTCFALTTLTPQHLIGNYIAAFMHHDDMPLFLLEFEASMSAGTPWRLHHRLRRADGTFAVFESTLNPFFDATSTEPAEYFGLHKCVMTLRPYSNPSTVLMDSYLDHITTNTRLVEQTRQLRSEAALADEEDNQEVLQETSYLIHLNPEPDHPSNELLRRAALKYAMDRNHALSDEAVSKLERKSGSGDIGIQIVASRLETINKTGSWTAKPCAKKIRKNAKPRDYICIQCGTKESPEWRTGSRGKKTLCNACGLRWAKAGKPAAVECAATMIECVSQS